MSSPADRPVHESIDAWLTERVVVVGSLPPGGRDLDLLVRPAAEHALARALDSAGFESFAGGWLRFAHGTVEQVDLIAAAGWGLPEDELDALLEESVPLQSGGQLARPAPHHTLLILARQLAADGGLAAKRRTRLQHAVREDVRAWESAHLHAAAWGAEQQLARLHAFACSGEQPHARGPAGTAAWRQRARLAMRPTVRRARRWRGSTGGSVIAFSGLDGAGKSSQAQSLRETLQKLGYDVAVEWTRIGWNEGFWGAAVAIKSHLNRIAGITPSRGSTPVDAVKELRQGSRLLTQVWATVLVLDDATARRRLIGHHLRAGRVVICDRYTLDSIVSLRCRFDDSQNFGFQRWLIKRLAPRPLRAFLLEVSPETAWERKGEHGLPWLRSHFAVYREECHALGARSLDGERPPHELSALIAADVWRALDVRDRRGKRTTQPVGSDAADTRHRKLPGMLTPSQHSLLDPSGRSPKRLRAHYEIERELATRLRQSTREQRLRLYGQVYDELFERVPDHPQHTMKDTPASARARVRTQSQLVEDFVDSATTFLELGAGDCALSFTVAPKVKQVYAVEVSQTISEADAAPTNFKLLLTNGIDMPIEHGTVTVAYSNQLMEHLHPDDAVEQVTNIYRALDRDGVYICLTPHALLGPSDISAFFDEVPTGFHLREYTTDDLVRLFTQIGFRRVRVIATVAGRRFYLPSTPFVLIGALAARLPRGLRRVGVVRKLISPGGGVVAYR